MSRKILISGGARGIGAACVKYFRNLGDKVVFIYRNMDPCAMNLAIRTDAIPIKGDVSDPEIAKKAFDEAIEELGGIDVLVNCAGMAQFRLFTENA